MPEPDHSPASVESPEQALQTTLAHAAARLAEREGLTHTVSVYDLGTVAWGSCWLIGLLLACLPIVMVWPSALTVIPVLWLFPLAVFVLRFETISRRRFHRDLSDRVGRALAPLDPGDELLDAALQIGPPELAAVLDRDRVRRAMARHQRRPVDPLRAREAAFGRQGHRPRVAPWAAELRVGSLLWQMPVRLLVFIIAPVAFVAATFALQSLALQLLMPLILILAFMGLLGYVGDLLLLYPWLGRVPVLAGGLRTLAGLQSYYYDHRPRHALVYVFYPLVAPVLMLRSAEARREAWLYVKIVGGLMLTMVAETALLYPDVYPPHLGWRVALGLVAVQLGLLTLALAGLVMPVFSTCYELALAGRQELLWGLALIGMLICVPVGRHLSETPPEGPTLIGQLRLDARLEQATFRRALVDRSRAWLAVQRAEVPTGGAGVRGVTMAASERLTAYRTQLEGLLPRDERRGLWLRVIRPAAAAPVWLAVSHQAGPEARGRLLLVVGPDGAAHTRWKTLPSEVRAPFFPVPDEALTARPDQLTSWTLIDD